MNIVIAVAALLCGTVLVALIQVIRRLTAAGRNLPVTAEWIDELSIERYRPMMRLLDVSDLEFLRSQPGFSPQAAAKLRIQRSQMFRSYLRSLNTDFGRICGALKLLMVQSHADRSDLALALMRQQLIFACGVVTVNFRLALYRYGLCGVDATALVRNFDSMRLELRTLVPASPAVHA